MFKGARRRARGQGGMRDQIKKEKARSFDRAFSFLIWLPLMDSNHRCLSQSQVPYRLAKGQCNVELFSHFSR